MFDVGFAELFLLSLIGLLVLGPERLPAVARTLGGALRKARTSWSALKRTIEAEMSAADAANPLRDVRDEVEGFQQQVRDFGADVERAVETPATDPASASDSEAGREPDPESEPESEPGSKPQPKSGSKPGSDLKHDAEPDTRAGAGSGGA